MPKGAAGSANSVLRALPSVERILSSAAAAPLVMELGRGRVKAAVAAHLQKLRHDRAPWDETAAMEAIRVLAGRSTSSSLRRVVNGTGVIIHTNLGRSPIAPEIWSRAGELASAYSNLEFD